MMKSAIALAALLSVAGLSQAKAEVAFPLWGCKLKAQVKDNSIAVGYGLVLITGEGTITCKTVNGSVKEDVVVNVLGVSAGPHIAIPLPGKADITVRSLSFGLSSIDQMDAQYTLAAGYSAQLGTLKAGVNRNFIQFTPAIPGNLSTGVSLAFSHGGNIGLGYNFNVTGMSIMSKSVALKKQFDAEQAWMNRSSEVQ